MIEVIHVKSTGHSGSTLLNLLLAENKDMRNSFDGTIFYDTEYIKEMGKMRWAALTFLMLPSLLAFKYPLRRKTVAAHAQSPG